MLDIPENALDKAASDAFDSQEPLVENLNPVPETAQEVKPEPVPSTVEAPKEPEEESFTKINPNELSEELKSIYKSMQADYTRKRQAEKQTIKELEDKLASSGQKAEFPKSKDNLSAEELVKQIARQTYIEEQETVWDQQATSDYPTLDERLNEDNPTEYDSLMDDFVRDRLTAALQTYVDKNGKKLGFDYKSEAKEAIKRWDEYVDDKVKSFVEKQNHTIKQKVDSSKKTTPNTVKAPTVPSGKMSIDDAIDAAFK
jgi:hypothetical protein